jgi:hypothetical protein
VGSHLIFEEKFMGNLTDSEDGDCLFSVHYTITVTATGEQIEGAVEVAAQDGKEAFMLAQDMNSVERLLKDADLPAGSGTVEWGDVELEEYSD